LRQHSFAKKLTSQTVIGEKLCNALLDKRGVSKMLMKFVFQINDGDEYWGLRHLVNAAEQAEEFAIAIWHKLQSWKVKKLCKISLFFSEHYS
jgi:hypothetical protein